MADRASSARRKTGLALQGRKRKRWAIAGSIAGVWLVLLVASGSATASMVMLLALAVLAGVCAVALRSLGIGRDHPLVRSLATRPWRDGREVLRIALQHLGEVFIITPGGTLLAPSAIELCMNPADVDSLASVIDLELVNVSAAEAYAAEIGASGARVRPGVPIEAAIIADPAVPAGRYTIRQRRQNGASAWAGSEAHASLPGQDWRSDYGPPDYGPSDHGRSPYVQLPASHGQAGRELHPTQTLTSDAATTGAAATDLATVRQLMPHPMLRLITGDTVAESRVSGACAGRGQRNELMLPGEPTISRVHAQFTCQAGQWRVACVGRNGLALNGTEVTGEQPVRDGDMISWGLAADALRSRVEIRP